MTPVVRFLDFLMLSSVEVAGLVVLLVFLPLFVYFTARAKGGARFPLRSIPVYARVRELADQVAESGRPLHVGLGSGQIGEEGTAEALMGLTVFDYVARHASLGDQPVLGTTADGTILAAAQGTLQAARHEVGSSEQYSGRELVFSGPDPLAYAAGSAEAVSREPYLGNILLGRFGAEGLWLAETLRGRNMVHVGGTSHPSAAALMTASLDDALIGEDVFAAGAYLHRPSHLGSLAAQDVVRIVLMLAIIAGVVLTSLGYWR